MKSIVFASACRRKPCRGRSHRAAQEAAGHRLHGACDGNRTVSRRHHRNRLQANGQRRFSHLSRASPALAKVHSLPLDRSRASSSALRIHLDAEAAGREVKVDLENAEATCYVEVTPSRALLYRHKIPGIGGLPTGSAGKLVCLLSGGFDSAVAAYKIIKRGVRLTFIHFYSPASPHRRGQSARRSRARKSPDTISGPLASIPRAFRRDPARSTWFRRPRATAFCSTAG